MRLDLVNTERYILKEMGFRTYVEHPHKFLLNFISVLKMKDNKELTQKAWNYLNDRFTLSLIYHYFYLV